MNKWIYFTPIFYFDTMLGKNLLKVFGNVALKRAMKFVQNEQTLDELKEDLKVKIGNLKMKKDFFDPAYQKLLVLSRMMSAYIKNEYRDISVSFFTLMIAGLIYFIMPFDAIADFIPGGYIDDFAFIALLYDKFNKQVDDFLSWEKNQSLYLYDDDEDEKIESIVISEHLKKHPNKSPRS